MNSRDIMRMMMGRPVKSQEEKDLEWENNRLRSISRLMQIDLIALDKLIGKGIDISEYLWKNRQNRCGFVPSPRLRHPYSVGMGVGHKVMRYDPWTQQFIINGGDGLMTESKPSARQVRLFVDSYMVFHRVFQGRLD